jgi:FAD/FMN-containing dehydrogenase
LAAKYSPAIATVKIAAGMRMFEIYQRMAKENLTIVGGADPNVGIGGWTGGGGHSPVSALYGLGADQVVKMEVVTADGEIRVLKGACEGPLKELFWAMRGVSTSLPFCILTRVSSSTGRPVNQPY